MKRIANNLAHFRCHSKGNSENNKRLMQENTLFETYKLIYVFDGVMQIEIDGRNFEAPRGFSALVFPFSRFRIKFDPAVKYVWLEFSGFACAAILSRIDFFKNKPVIGTIDLEGFEELFDVPEETGEPYALYRFAGCILLLMSYYIEQFPGSYMEYDTYVQRACGYIDANFCTQGFSVKDVTEKLKIDRSHLFRLFREEMGMSVIEYITHRRVARAEILLAGSSMTVKDIAYSVGYSDQMYFSRVFKKFTGSSPTQYRENALQEV